MSDAPLVFALHGSQGLGAEVAAALQAPLAMHEEREFEDGEHKARPLESVRGRDVYVIHTLHGDRAGSANDRLLRLLFFIGALRDAGAARVTALAPYLAYARKDQRTKPRDPVTTRYVAQLFEAVGTDCVVTVDVHNVAAFQNAFRCRTEHLEAGGLLAERCAELAGDAPVAVVAPDAGGIKRADRFRERLSARLGRPVGSAFMEKYRSGGVLRGAAFAGDVEGRVAIVIDDLVSAGHTIDRAARACVERGASRVYAAATHGLFAGEAAAVLTASPLAAIVVTDTVAPARVTDERLRALLQRVSVAGLLAAAIAALHGGGSVSALNA